MPPSLFEHLTEIDQRLRAAPAVALFLDFDGTLAPLAHTPGPLPLPPELRQILETLSGQNDLAVTILSGRMRSDLHASFGLPGVFYVGNHGLEISGPGCLFVEPEAAAQQELVQELAARLTARLQSVAGVQVEDKGLTLTVHYRLVEAEEREEVRRRVHATLADANYPFLITPGRMAFEIRPRVYWTKGSAVTWILGQLGKPTPLSFYFGDDLTDESAFAELPEGITVQVGEALETVAHYRVASPEEVQEFLAWLADHRLGKRRPPFHAKRLFPTVDV